VTAGAESIQSAPAHSLCPEGWLGIDVDAGGLKDLRYVDVAIWLLIEVTEGVATASGRRFALRRSPLWDMALELRAMLPLGEVRRVTHWLQRYERDGFDGSLGAGPATAGLSRGSGTYEGVTASYQELKLDTLARRLPDFKRALRCQLDHRRYPAGMVVVHGLDLLACADRKDIEPFLVRFLRGTRLHLVIAPGGERQL
jgi:hypothetical protein